MLHSCHSFSCNFLYKKEKAPGDMMETPGDELEENVVDEDVNDENDLEKDMDFAEEEPEL